MPLRPRPPRGLEGAELKLEEGAGGLEGYAPCARRGRGHRLTLKTANAQPEGTDRATANQKARVRSCMYKGVLTVHACACSHVCARTCVNVSVPLCAHEWGMRNTAELASNKGSSQESQQEGRETSFLEGLLLDHRVSRNSPRGAQKGP